jgi:parallel beta-helix repeat protein
VGAQEVRVQTPTFNGSTIIIQTDRLGNYQAINQTDSSVLSSSQDAGSLINSVINDNSSIILGLGTFTLESQISVKANNVTIEGQGKGTILKVASSDLNAFQLNRVNDWVIRNLLIDGSKSGVDASACNYIMISETQITNTHYDAIGLFNCINCTVLNNNIFNCTEGFAIHVWNTTDCEILNNNADFTYWSVIAVSDGSNNNLIQGNIASRGGQNGTLGDGIEIGSTPKAGGAFGNVVINNTCNDNIIDGISVAQSNDTVVSNNLVFNNYVQGISVESNCTHTWLIGNVIYNNSAVTPHGAGGIIVMGADTTGTTISGNTIYRNWQHGILLYQSSNSTVSGNRIFNNGQKSPGVYDGVSVASENNTVTDNRCYDDQLVPTQRFGVNVLGGFLGNVLVGNVFSVP